MWSWFVLFVAHFSATTSQNMFTNPDFEDAGNVLQWGYPWKYKQDIVTDSTAKQGGHYLRVYDRQFNWQGPGQDVAMKSNTNYNISCWYKILNSNTHLFQNIMWTISYQWKDGSDEKTYLTVAERSMQDVSNGWMLLNGDFTTPSRPWFKAHVYVQGPDPGIDYLIDDASLVQVVPNSRWETEANQRIEQIRKNNFTLQVHLPPEYDPLHTEVEINLRNHEFGFGTVVDDQHVLDKQFSTGYQNILYEFFNWATVQTFKWGYNRGTVQNPDYNTTLKVVDELRRNGMKVRGHNMFWGVGSNDPAEVRRMNATQLKRTIDERIRYMTSWTRGKLEHWDINNELLHGQVYEEITRDPKYSEKIFDKVHNADPYPKLFLNEYDVVAVGAETQAYLEQAMKFKKNSHLDAIGVQSHFPSLTEPDPTLIKGRLDRLAQVGLPIWVTELTMVNPDEHARADWLEHALKTYFSHPSVKGVIFWGFWDEYGNVDSSLVNGNYFHINEAGKRYLQLVKKEWSTNVKIQLTGHSNKINIRGFLGEYDVIVRYYGKPIMLSSFTNQKNMHKAIQINVPTGNHVIVLPTARPTSVSVTHVHHVTASGRHMVGHASSSSTASSLQCTTRYSSFSEIGDDKTASIGCQDGEVMTGCSMVTKDRLHFRDGEKIDNTAGNMVCTAVNAWQSTAPVQAIARCCKLSGLQCDYLAAGPSGLDPDDQVEVLCSGQQFALGCTSYTYFRDFDGAFSNTTSCVAQNDGHQGGVFVYASCCSAPQLSCNVKKSPESGLKQGSEASVQCDNGEQMTGCSVYTEDGNTAGAMIRDSGSTSTCHAYNGLDKFPGEMGAVAFATCCSTN